VCHGLERFLEVLERKFVLCVEDMIVNDHTEFLSETFVTDHLRMTINDVHTGVVKDLEFPQVESQINIRGVDR
jgi:hypothetical protein